MTLLTYVLFGALGVLAAVILKNRYISFLGQTPEDYEGGPTFDIREQFIGPVQCEGIIYGPTGRVSSRFTARFDCHWSGNVCTMDEVFHYDSGSIQNRQWTLTLNEDGTIKAEAPDVIGAGTGRQKGSAVLLNYRIQLTEDAGAHVLDVTDWMYLMQNGAIMNRSQFRKFGIQVAELVATMRPIEAEVLAAE